MITIGAQLKKQDGVKEIKYVSADEAWDTFKDQYFGESSDLAEGFKNDNPLAGSDNYEVYMMSGFTEEAGFLCGKP